MSIVARLVALALLACLFVSPALAQETDKSLVWERFDSTIDVQPDGSAEVTETQAIRYESGRWTEGGRKIPLDRVDDIRDVSVSLVEENGEEVRLRSETYVEDGELQIAWGYPATFGGEDRTFRLRYTVDGLVGVYPDNQQVRWIAVPNERRFPVEESTVRLQLPTDVAAEELRLESYPPRLRGEEQPTEQGALFQVGALPAFEGFEVRARFPAGTVPAATAPLWQEAVDRQDFINETIKPTVNVGLLALGFAIPILGLVGLIGLWFTRGRDPGVGRDPESVNTPPSDLPAPLAGVLLDEEANVQDVVSTIVSLAERGVLRITQVTNEELMGSNADYELELLQPYRPQDLRQYERTVVDTLFNQGQEQKVLLSQAKFRFQSAIPIFQDQLYDEVVRAGLFRGNPERVRRRYRGLGTALLVLGVLGGCLGTAVLSQYADPFFVFLPALGLAALGFGMRTLARAMPVRTLNGAVEASRWRGFRNYLAHIERTPDIAQDKGAFERYLSYATAFNLGRSWLEKFASVGTPAPSWYRQARGAGMDVFDDVAVPGGFGRRRRYGGMGGFGGPIIIVPPFGGGYGGGGTPGGGPAAPGPGGVEGGGLFGGDSGLFDFGDDRSVLDRAGGGFGDLLDQAGGAFGGGSWGGGGAGGFGGGSGGGGADFG